jgi:hypothetical protein
LIVSFPENAILYLNRKSLRYRDQLSIVDNFSNGMLHPCQTINLPNYYSLVRKALG